MTPPADGILSAGPTPDARTLVDILHASAVSNPQASALADTGGTLSYRELLREVNRAAARLAEAGVRPGDRVGIRIPSGTRTLYIGILATLVAGAAYVPVDADDPDERAALVFGEAAVVGVIGVDGELVLRETAVPPGRGAGAAATAPADAAAGAPDAAAPEHPGAAAGAHPSTAGIATLGSATGTLPVVGGPTPDLDAWIIFTSGSTGTPKGVAVTHRSAAAFVDAEARLFLQGDPIGPGDRVLAGLSVAFDASCEEMWLAWRHGACLVPAPRSLVRSGVDLGPWLIAHGVTIVSTVPTLAALWPLESLELVRLLIFGGEACPPELVARLAVDGREVWNTYGPTEATVVACGAQLDGVGPVRIGLPLDGWLLAVVDDRGHPVAEGETGELIIGGVGLARYLDAAKDAEKYAPMPTLGWTRAYRSGDLVVFDRAGLLFQGRADDQVKLGGRRIELGEVEAAIQALPGVAGAAAVVQRTAAGNQVLVGYLALSDTGGGATEGGAGGAGGASGAGASRTAFDTGSAIQALRETLPAALIPLLAVVDSLPTRTSGKVDKAALPWPLPAAAAHAAADASTADATSGAGAGAKKGGSGALSDTALWIAGHFTAILGAPVTGPDDDFFAFGGGSLSAAQLVSVIRTRFPETTVADIYDHPRIGALATELDARAPVTTVSRPPVLPTPAKTQLAQTLLGIPLYVLVGLRWLVYVLAANNVLQLFEVFPWAPTVSWWWLLVGFVVLITPFGRMAISVASARALLAGVEPGEYPRGGSVHVRLWLAEQIAQLVGATNLAGAPWIITYARALGAKIAPGVDLHTLPPITGMLKIGARASVEPEVDVSGYWIDGDVLRLGSVQIGADAAVGARSTLLPGTRIGRRAEIAPGSSVAGRVPAGQLWAGSPAERRGKAHPDWPDQRPPRNARWLVAFALGSVALSLLPVVSVLAGAAVVGWSLGLGFGAASAAGSAAGSAAASAAGTAAVDTAAVALPAVASALPTLGDAALRALAAIPLATLAAGIVYAGLTVIAARLLGLGLRPGSYPVRSRIGWQVWATERLLDAARTVLFPFYASLFTPVWLRMLGATVGKNVEASTVLLLPRMTTIADQAFLADDTMVASYELGGGWLRIGEAKVGKRAFLGNSGMTGPGRSVPRNGLVAVLSATPKKAKSGSSWLGNPPVRLRRQVTEFDEGRTFRPSGRLKLARALWELGRIVPVMISIAIGLGIAVLLELLLGTLGLGWTIVLSGAVMLAGGAVAAVVTTAAKWALVGRIRQGEHPLWSSFVWRNEVSDTFVEMVAAPWFANAASGTPALAWWLRSIGATIGRGAWIETYWLPEADLISIGAGATVNRGVVVQTHLFHDRVMSLDSVALDDGATIGPHGVILPAASIGVDATVGPASLVMRGEHVPRGSRWAGNPIAPWAGA
ncbi:Pls/PosA family non-ribosomal peptide synthetase [Subtercola boreus]|uniref:Amino acid adenylation protein n=1 Tax=Subtercola boreus TaxID=120213 RepID=A0A3E0WB72_9MICO|nr:Pls/PosA family non-ribosomal peptide synthetase [Subtercola boreus]RFA20258.1 amino acid adenylation protein [Subtercola boreus]RFA20410.1 amino acid adenylation protein [Subtercola boreus]RFA26662.1 amino acid adenylation protein [Subtercola boreus]